MIDIARPVLIWLLAVGYFSFGVVHLISPDSLMPLMPAWVPFPREMILFTGACEIAGAAGLVFHRARPFAGAMLALYALCVWPANFHHAFTGVQVGQIPNSWWYHGPRLLFQPVLIWAPLYAAGILSWPSRRRSPSPDDITVRMHGLGPR